MQVETRITGARLLALLGAATTALAGVLPWTSRSGAFPGRALPLALGLAAVAAVAYRPWERVDRAATLGLGCLTALLSALTYSRGRSFPAPGAGAAVAVALLGGVALVAAGGYALHDALVAAPADASGADGDADAAVESRAG